MVFQNYALYPHLNVADNMAFGLRIRKMPKARDQNHHRQCSRSFRPYPPILIAGPPTCQAASVSALLWAARLCATPKYSCSTSHFQTLMQSCAHQMRAEIKRLHNRLGVTSIYVTHDQVEAMTLADRIVVMNDGRIEQVGTPDGSIQQPRQYICRGGFLAPRQ